MKFKYYHDYTEAEWEQLPNYQKETILEMTKQYNEKEIERLYEEIRRLDADANYKRKVKNEK